MLKRLKECLLRGDLLIPVIHNTGQISGANQSSRGSETWLRRTLLQTFLRSTVIGWTGFVLLQAQVDPTLSQNCVLYPKHGESK